MALFHRQITPILRALQFALLAQGAVVAAAFGQATSATGVAGDLPPEVRALLDAMQPKWSLSATAHAGVGYKDNVVLSHAGAQGSGFARGGVDFFVWHPPRLSDGRVDYFTLAKVEGTEFFRRDTIDHEAEASAIAEWRYRIGDTFKFAVDAHGLYLDQVLDVSDTDVLRVVVPSKKTVAAVGPTMRWAPKPWAWVEVQGLAKRESYRDTFNNADVGEGTLQLGWKPVERLELRLTGVQSRRKYDSREQYSAGGRPLAGTALRIGEREAEARIDVTWDQARHWKTTTRIGKLDYDDNGSGYFNYRQRRIRQRLEWEAGRWSVRFEGGAKRRDFEVLTVGVGIAPPLRVKEEFSTELRIERKITDRWKLFAEYTWERSRCNETIASYRMNEGLLGALWSWEK